MLIVKRQLWLLSLFSLIFLVLLGRLSYIQLIGTESFSKHNVNLIKKAIQQRQQQIVLHSGRGEITDRYGQSLTGKSTFVLVLFPLLRQTDADVKELDKVAKVLHLPVSTLTSFLEELKEPKMFISRNGIFHLSEQEANQINELAIPGVLGLPYEMRYNPDQLLSQHLIGYIGQNPEYIKSQFAQELAQGALHENSEIGISGLEKTFQPFLQGLGPVALSYFVDARGKPLQGMDIKYTNQDNSFYPLVVQSTLDKELQGVVEGILDDKHIQEGTVIVLDNESSEILAMSSRPNFFDQMTVPGAWENKAVKRYTPGSVFKIIIAAAALESDLVTLHQTFQCDGVLEGTNFHCWKHEGHGHITFEQAFAQSCNIVFGQLANQLGAEKIEEFAQKLGVVEQNGWNIPTLFHFNHFKQLDGEEGGQVYSSNRTIEEKNDRNYLLHTGIGQLDVQVTPLAVANMLATISKGGNKHQVKAVQDILYQNGASFYHFPKQKIEGDTITPFTAYQLQKLMAGVVESGTAKVLKDKKWSAGGKTGTAQVKALEVLTPEVDKNHQWFAGFYPQNNPRYSIAVVTFNQQSNTRNMSIDIFADIIDWLDRNR